MVLPGGACYPLYPLTLMPHSLGLQAITVLQPWGWLISLHFYQYLYTLNTIYFPWDYHSNSFDSYVLSISYHVSTIPRDSCKDDGNLLAIIVAVLTYNSNLINLHIY